MSSMKKLTPREAKWLAQVHTAGNIARVCQGHTSSKSHDLPDKVSRKTQGWPPPRHKGRWPGSQELSIREKSPVHGS